MIPGLDNIIGGILGLIGGVVNGFTEVRKHKAETERLKAQWEHDEKMFVQETNAKREDNADASFQASLHAGCDGSPFALPSGSYPWLLVPLVAVESLRRVTRPLLTWGLVGAAYFNPTMQPAAMMAVGWWFGSRTTSRFLEK